MQEIEDYAAECRAYWLSIGFSEEWADRLRRETATALYGMYENSHGSADRLATFDGLLKILRERIPVREKLAAVAAYLADAAVTHRPALAMIKTRAGIGC